MYRPMLIVLALMLLCISLDAPTAQATDWPQFQANAQRTGYSPDSIAPPYRARWIWCGPTQTLRNHASNAAWPDDLTTRDNYNYPMPSSVNFTLADFVQPVVANSRVFVGDQQGSVYAINYDDGSNLWTAALPGGTIHSAAVSGTTVVFASITGYVRGYDVSNGSVRWTVNTGRSITSAPLVFNSVLYVGDHAGNVRAIDPANGNVSWTRKLGGPIQGCMAASGTKIYVPADNMTVYALNTSNGTIANQRVVTGQSFRGLWPVITGSLVYVQSAMVPCAGSEYVAEDVCQQATSITDEGTRMIAFQSGQGGYSYTSTDWEHLTALNLSDLTKPFSIGCGPSEGCGTSAEPPVVRADGKAICYWKTKYPKLTNASMFGSNYAADLSAIDPTNGTRIVIDNGRLAGVRMETDNMYGLSIGGNYMFMRQRFRGTQGINMADSTSRYISQESRYRDGGNYTSDIIYDSTNDSVEDAPGTPEPDMSGRCPATVSGTLLLISEPYCITAIEHY